MTTPRLARFAITLLAAMFIVPATSHAQGTCLLAGKEVALRREAIARTIADSATRRMAVLPAVTDSGIAQVRDERTCTAARNGHNAALPVKEQSFDRPVYVIKVGDVYSIDDPTVRFGEFGFTVTPRASFAVLPKYVH